MEFYPIRITFFFFAFLAALCTLFCAVVLISSSADVQVTKDLSWAHGSFGDSCFVTGNCFDVYVSINNFVNSQTNTDLTTTDVSTKWGSDNCTPDFCDHCYRTMLATIGLVALTLIATVPVIFAAYKRTTEDGNNASNQKTVFFGSLFAIASGICCVIVFAAGCQTKVEDASSGQGIDWEYGPSFGLIIAVIIFEGVVLISNAIIPLGTEGCGCFKHEAFAQEGSMKVKTSDSKKKAESKEADFSSVEVSNVENGADNKV